MEVWDASQGYDLRAVKPAVPAGYKQTEVGVIPEDWGLRSLAELFEFSGGFAASRDQLSSDGHCYLHYGDIHGATKSFVDTRADYQLIPKLAIPLKRIPPRSLLQDGDVVFVDASEDDEGTSKHVVVVNKDGLPFISGLHTIVAKNKTSDLSHEYRRYCFQTADIRRQFLFYAVGTKVSGISKTNIPKLLLPVPSLEEQRAIATALSDVDALLEALDRLIAKKRDLKQAAMQQLLTGQTRLPGFEGEWETIRLGDHVTFLKNGTNARAELRNDGVVRYLHYGDIHASVKSTLEPFSLPFLPIAKAKILGRLQDGDLIFADASEDMEGVGKSVELINVGRNKLVGGLHTIAARFNKSILADGFKAYLQFCPEFIATLRQLAAGTKVYATSRSHIAGIEMRLPKVEEQRAIAAILHDMDAEIEALEKRRTKSAALKQAMMQELLTGRIRLVEHVHQDTSAHKSRSNGKRANVYFMRSVLAAEIVDQLHAEPTFGHVKFEKMLFLVEHLCDVDTGSTYHRQAAGPYDNRALRSIDIQLRKQQWFDAREEHGRYRYMPLQKRGGHKHYFDRYFSEVAATFNEIVETFRGLDTERCEIVATLFAAWRDLLREKGNVSDEIIVHEVLNNWHESKQRIPEDRWLNALAWMREKGFVPKGEVSS